MIARKAEANWDGNLKDGSGSMKLGSGAFEGRFSFGSRFEERPGTNPEELIAAAHAGCFSMALSHHLSQLGFAPKHIHTTARVYLERKGEGFEIPRIDFKTEAEIPGIDKARFQTEAETAKRNCPVSKVLAGATIQLEATLR